MIWVMGYFDGFHLGHQLLLKEANRAAKERGRKWGVLSFAAHPKEVLLDKPMGLLFSRRERRFLAGYLEVPVMEEMPFDRSVAEMSPIDFLYLVERKFAPSGVVVGDNFRFGRGRAGDVAVLREFCLKRGWFFKTLRCLEVDGDMVSSTRIRGCVESGAIYDANRLLGYPFMMLGRVVHGDGRGRGLGFPTANISLPPSKLIPGRGVYAAAAWVRGGWRSAALNIGFNPTFQGVRSIRVEAHLVGFDGDIYGSEMAVFPLKMIRDERRFGSSCELIKQMERDVEECRRIFVEVPHEFMDRMGKVLVDSITVAAEARKIP
ncbi:MAG: riboflavin biosynthesis protein RibF [Thermanaerothrix sp.]|nr:riboflavin biosynthesis protein RibF [Thermanaerothrix sp.]